MDAGGAGGSRRGALTPHREMHVIFIFSGSFFVRLQHSMAVRGCPCPRSWAAPNCRMVAAQVRKHGGPMDVNAEGLPAWRAGPLRTAAADKAAQVRKHGGAMDGPPCV